MSLKIDPVLSRALSENPLGSDDALRILAWPDSTLEHLLSVTRTVRHRHFGDRVECCGIVNARSGQCGEDCRFCAQSAHHSTNKIDVYSLISDDALTAARSGFPAKLRGRFGIVTSGGALSDAECERIENLLHTTPDHRVPWCASLGMLDEPALRRLRASGLRRYHHNIETAESHFPAICSTHTYAERVATVRAAKRAGLEVCCGVLFGLGEKPTQRVEAVLALRDLAVDAIPLNFLVPVPGTPMAASPPSFSQNDVLRIISMVRLLCPRTPVRLCGGRERYLSDQMGRAFDAGATGMMIGGYLTLRGHPVESDLAMIQRAGYRPEWHGEDEPDG